MSVPAQEIFVPLAAASQPNRGEDFRVLVAERPESARPLRDASAAATTGASSQNHRSLCEPRVTLQRDAQVITGIRIECSCGQIIDLKCAYQDGLSTSSA